MKERKSTEGGIPQPGRGNVRAGLKTVLFALAAILCALSLLACKKGEQASVPPGLPKLPVSAVRVVPRDVPVDLDYLGQTEASREIEVRTRVEGFLVKQEFIEGKRVKQGDVLFRLDRESFEVLLEESRAQLALEEARLENARRNVTRLRPLVALHAVSQKDLDDALSQETTAKASVHGARAKVRAAEINLGYTVITSPLAGITGRVQKNEGSLLSPGPAGLLTTVSQIDPIYVDFSASESELLQYNKEVANKRILPPAGGNFTVELKLSNGAAYPLKGKLNFANPFFNKETGTMSMRADFANPRSDLLPGLFVRVLLKGAVRPHALLVPQRAVLQGQKGKYLYVVAADGRAELRNVEVGEWYGDEWIITSGLKGNEVVAVDGAAKLQAGAPVSITAMADQKKSTAAVSEREEGKKGTSR